MLTWIRRLFDPGRAFKTEVRTELDAFESRLDMFYAELKKLRGRVVGNERREKAPEVAPGEEIEAPPGTTTPPARKVAGTAHLSRRFRIGG